MQRWGPGFENFVALQVCWWPAAPIQRCGVHGWALHCSRVPAKQQSRQARSRAAHAHAAAGCLLRLSESHQDAAPGAPQSLALHMWSQCWLDSLAGSEVGQATFNPWGLTHVRAYRQHIRAFSLLLHVQMQRNHEEHVLCLCRILQSLASISTNHAQQRNTGF